MKKTILPLFLLVLAACQHPAKHTEVNVGSQMQSNEDYLPAGNTKVSVFIPPYDMTGFVPARKPSSVVKPNLQSLFKCGKIEYSESNYYAKDSNDNIYAVTLDCNKDNRISKADGYYSINIPESFISKEYKSWLTQWKRQRVKNTKRAKSNPFLCVSVEVSSDPCVSHKNVIGFNPEFSVVKK